MSVAANDKVAELTVAVSQLIPTLLFGVAVNRLFPVPLLTENTCEVETPYFELTVATPMAVVL
jgi:hypothetical protein